MRKGFTLLELMVTLGLVVLVMVIVYGIIRSTIQNATKIEQVMQGVEVGPALLSQIREDLEGVLLLDPEEEQFWGQNKQASGGGRDRIDFLTTTMAYEQEEEDAEMKFYGLNEVGYQLKDNPDNSSLGILYRRIDPFVDEDPLQGGKLVEMYDRVVRFNIEYIEDPEKDPEKEWSNKEKEGALPRAFVIELELQVSDIDAPKQELRQFRLTVTRPQ